MQFCRVAQSIVSAGGCPEEDVSMMTSGDGVEGNRFKMSTGKLCDAPDAVERGVIRVVWQSGC